MRLITYKEVKNITNPLTDVNPHIALTSALNEIVSVSDQTKLIANYKLSRNFHNLLVMKYRDKFLIKFRTSKEIFLGKFLSSNEVFDVLPCLFANGWNFKMEQHQSF